jgi:hypothetical protein
MWLKVAFVLLVVGLVGGLVSVVLHWLWVRHSHYRGSYAHVPKARLAIFVLTSPSTIEDRGKAVADTWAVTAREYGVDVFTSKEDTLAKYQVLSIPVPDTDYNHIYLKVYAAFAWLWKERVGQYDWIMKTDDDTYVDVPTVLEFLRKRNASEPHLLGKVDILMPSGKMCWGGPGYSASQELVSTLAPHLANCTEGKNGVYIGSEDISFSQCAVHHYPGFNGCVTVPRSGREDWEFFMSIDGSSSTWLEIGERKMYKDKFNHLAWSFEESATFHKVLPANMYILHAWRVQLREEDEEKGEEINEYP